MHQTFSILVDDRESTGAVAKALQRDPRAIVRVQRLPIGDYFVDDAPPVRAQDAGRSGGIDQGRASVHTGAAAISRTRTRRADPGGKFAGSGT